MFDGVSRIPSFVLVAAIVVAGCAAPGVDDAPAVGDNPAATKPTPAPPFELSAAEKTRLLFPALLEPPNPDDERCVRSRRGATPPSWLAEAARETSCTDSARAALQAADGPAPTRTVAQDLLTAAALCDDFDAMKHALATGADPNRHDSCGWTALVAAAAGHPDSVRMLLEAGARAKLESRQGRWSRPPLLAALIARDTASARLLVDARAPVDAQTAGGRSALMFAAATRDTVLVRALLRRRADPCHRDSRGLTATTVARVYGSNEVLSLLERAASKCVASGTETGTSAGTVASQETK